MSDLISRQAAIDALVKAIREDPYYDSNEPLNGLGVCDVRVILNDLPSVQPDLQPTCNNLETDCISRQAAIDALCSVCGVDCDKSEFVYDGKQEDQVILCPEHYVLTQLPSAQPDPCDVCAHKDCGDMRIYCPAERRTDERQT